MSHKKFYKKCEWLNNENSPSVGNVVAYDGICTDEEGEYRNIFLSVSDCYHSARLHKTPDDSVEDFISKLKILKSVIGEFINHLENNKNV